MHLPVRVGLFRVHLPVDFTPSDVFDKFLSTHQYTFLASLHSNEQSYTRDYMGQFSKRTGLILFPFMLTVKLSLSSLEERFGPMY